jgi:hypothetical protein
MTALYSIQPTIEEVEQETEEWSHLSSGHYNSSAQRIDAKEGIVFLL